MLGLIKNYHRSIKFDRRKFPIPVISYHEISTYSNSPWIVSLDDFKKQMYYIKDSGFNTITVDELYAYLICSLSIPPKTIVVTFDDAWIGQYEFAAPFLKKINSTATFYIPSGCIDKKKPVASYGKDIMNWKHIVELSHSGFDIQAHSSSHRDLVALSYRDLQEETSGVKKRIEDKINKEVSHFAYPYDRFNKNIELSLVNYGYKTAAYIPYLLDEDDKILLYKIVRYHIYSKEGIKSIKKILQALIHV